MTTAALDVFRRDVREVSPVAQNMGLGTAMFSEPAVCNDVDSGVLVMMAFESLTRTRNLPVKLDLGLKTRKEPDLDARAVIAEGIESGII